MFFVLGADLRSIYILPTIVMSISKPSCEIRWLILVIAFGFHANV